MPLKDVNYFQQTNLAQQAGRAVYVIPSFAGVGNPM
jgi:hypothetical protein